MRFQEDYDLKNSNLVKFKNDRLVVIIDFETGIVSEHSVSNEWKIILFLKSRHLSNWIIRLTEQTPQNMLHIFVVSESDVYGRQILTSKSIPSL